MVIGKGYEDGYLEEAEVRELASQAFAAHALTGKRVLVIIPDHTRTAPIPCFSACSTSCWEGRWRHWITWSPWARISR